MTLEQSRETSPFVQTPIPSARSVTRTLRIDEDIEARVVGMAERDHVSFNLLATGALRKLAEWEDKADKFGFVQVPRAIVNRVFSSFTDEVARELGKQSGLDLLPEMVLFWFKKFDRETAVKTLELMAEHGKWFRLERSVEGRSEIVIVKHDRGPRVSAYHSELLKSFFGSLGAAVETTETDGQVVANISYPAGNSNQRVNPGVFLGSGRKEDETRLKASPITVRLLHTPRPTRGT